MKKITYLIPFLLSLTVINSAIAQQQHPVVIKMGNVMGDTASGQMPLHTSTLQKLIAEKVEEYTNGEVKWEILEGKRDDIPVFTMPAMTAKGDVIQASNVPSLFMPRVPEMLIQSIPFLFESDEHSRRFMGSEADLWLSAKVEETYNVKVLGSIHHSNAASVNSITPILEPEDFEGKILNDFSESWKPLWENITPKEITYIGYAEAVEGALVGPNATTEINIGMLQNNYAQRLYERYRYLTLVPNMYNIYYMVLINKQIWDDLTQFQRDGINRAVTDAQHASIALHMDTMLNALQLNRSSGVKIHYQTDEEKAHWKAEFYPKMEASVVSRTSDPIQTQKIINKIKALVNDLEWN